MNDLEAVLVRALDAAVSAGNLDAVQAIVGELRARRLEAAGNVVELSPRRRQS